MCVCVCVCMYIYIYIFHITIFGIVGYQMKYMYSLFDGLFL